MIRNYPKWKYEYVTLPLFAKLQKKAKKFNVTLELKVLEEYWENIGKNFHTEMVEYVKVEITGADLGIAGWQVVARIEHLEQGNIINAYSEMPEVYRENKGSCDHCHTNRTRSVTYILKNEFEEYKQVGKTCLKDFFAMDPGVILFKESIYKEMDEEDNRDFYGKSAGFEVEEIMQASAMIIRRHGYLSKAKSQELQANFCTRDYLFRFFSPDISEHDRKFRQEMFENCTEQDIELAAKVTEWFKELVPVNDYQENLKVIFAGKYCKEKHWGYLVSAIPFYQRQMGIEFEKKYRPESNFQGEIGKRLEFQVKLIKHLVWDSDFGTTHFYIMEDLTGNLLTWKSSRYIYEFHDDRTNEIKQEVMFKLKGTVKAHTVYKDRKQTELSRCKVLD